MDPIIGGALIGAGSQVAGGLIDQAFAKRNDKRARTQHQAFTDINSKANKELAEFGHSLQRDMFDYTTDMSKMRKNYEEAGLNPLAINAMGGSMGQSVSGGGGSSSASDGGTRGGDTMGMAMQLQQMKTAERLAEAEIKLKEAQADSTRKGIDKYDVDIAETTAKIDNIVQDTENKKTARLGMILQNDIDRIEARIKGATEQEAIQMYTNSAKVMGEQAKALIHSNEINEQTKNEVIESYKLQNGKMIAEIMAKNSGINVDNATINKMGADIINNIDKLKLEGRRVNITELEHELRKNYPTLQQLGGGVAKSLADAIDDTLVWLDKGVSNMLGIESKGQKIIK